MANFDFICRFNPRKDLGYEPNELPGCSTPHRNRWDKITPFATFWQGVEKKQSAEYAKYACLGYQWGTKSLVAHSKKPSSPSPALHAARHPYTPNPMRSL